ncbi:TPA: methyltransferase domain-containing protein [Vibrio vulnificus]|nr:methyltransferase domain-containing protein [Vibrio vulnificus]
MVFLSRNRKNEEINMKSGTLKTKGFKFKQFSIASSNSGMPVSTDGVLLGAWANFHHCQNLLDIGTGTGLLSLMCAQRYAHLSITAVDIDEHAVEAAQENFSHSPWHSRLQLQHGDVLKLDFTHRFDGIICNPPYFNNGEQSQATQRATARHTDTLAHDALLLRCRELLTPNGKANFVLPLTEGEQFLQLAQQQGWHLHRLCHVKPSPNKPVHRLLFELGLSTAITSEEHLTINDGSTYSAAFVKLCQDFYLKM